MPVSRTLALIDGDIVIHRCAAALDNPVERTARGTYRFDLSSAIRNVRSQLTEIGDSVKADRSVVCLTAPTNFRKQVHPGYKGNRTGRKPIMFAELREKLVESGKFETFERPGIEADDCMGIIATKDLKAFPEERRVICTIDKDLRTIPGLHWNWDKQVAEFDEPDFVSLDEADLTFYRQVLVGDSTDGFSGCPGIGPVKAKKLLPDGMDPIECWDLVVQAFVKEGLTDQDALLNARCARILRGPDYDFNKKEPILWTPS